jgi:hypothetical protein
MMTELGTSISAVSERLSCNYVICSVVLVTNVVLSCMRNGEESSPLLILFFT